MTIAYTSDVSSGGFADFTKLLLRWHGSVWKNVCKELFIWLVVYTILSILYRNILSPDQKIVFEDLVAYGHHDANFIPLNFILGFFVTLVVQRWWEMFNLFGWIDNVALYVGMYIEGNDDRMRMIRRNIVRYVALSQAMIFRDISPVVRSRFPTDEAFEISGYLTNPERRALESVVTSHGKYWVPIHWSFCLLKEARKSGNIASDRAVELIQDRIREYRTGLAKLRGMYSVPVPLAYVQVVFLATRSYLALGLLGRQYIHSDRHPEISQIDLYVPVVSILQFIFYLGWMKVAEALLNPFGDDDDDFECNWFLDRNLQMGLSAADDAIGKEPPLDRDVFWNDITPIPFRAHSTNNNMPIDPHNISKTKRTAMYSFLRNLIMSRFFSGGCKTNKVVDIVNQDNKLDQEAVNNIPDSSDQHMFKDEWKIGLADNISHQLSTGSMHSLTHSPRDIEWNVNSFFTSPSMDVQRKMYPGSTIVKIEN